MPVCLGVVEARARVVINIAEANTIQVCTAHSAQAIRSRPIVAACTIASSQLVRPMVALSRR